MAQLKRPPKGDVWLFVDQLQRADGRVWAVSYWDDQGRHCYECARSVICSKMMFTQFFGPRASQPKAVIVIPKGTVRICDDFAYIN